MGGHGISRMWSGRARSHTRREAVRIRADLKLFGRTDCTVAHHTHTLTQHWYRDDLAHHADALITDARAAYAPASYLCATPRLRLQSPHYQKPDGLHARYLRILSDQGLAVFCDLWDRIDESGVFPTPICARRRPHHF